MSFPVEASSMDSGQPHTRQQYVQSRTHPVLSLNAPFSGQIFRYHTFPHVQFPSPLPYILLNSFLGSLNAFHITPALEHVLQVFPRALHTAKFYFASSMSMYVGRILCVHALPYVLCCICRPLTRAAPNLGNIIAQTFPCRAMQLLPTRTEEHLQLNSDQTNPPWHKEQTPLSPL